MQSVVSQQGRAPCLGVSLAAQRKIVSDSKAKKPTVASPATNTAELIREVAPMGDLGRFLIEDMSPEQEDELYRILEGA